MRGYKKSYPKSTSLWFTSSHFGSSRFAALGFDSALPGNDIISVSIRENNTFLKLFSKIQKSRTLKSEMYGLENIRDIYGIILFLLQSEQERYIPTAKIKILQPALDFMVENYSFDEITNEQLAELCGISTVYFRKVFRAVYGTSPISYLNNIRIGRAKDMLCSDFDSVSQIAESVGYNSIYHFSKMFKVYTGQTPSAFAKKQIITKSN